MNKYFFQWWRTFSHSHVTGAESDHTEMIPDRILLYKCTVIIDLTCVWCCDVHIEAGINENHSNTKNLRIPKLYKSDGNNQQQFSSLKPTPTRYYRQLQNYYNHWTLE